MLPYTGEILALTVAFLWAMASLIYTKVGETVPAFDLNLLKGILAVGMLVITLLVRFTLPVGVPFKGFGLLSISGIVGIAMGDTAYLQALQAIGPRKSTLIKLLSAPSTSLIAFTFLGETLSLRMVAGILLTLFGVGLVLSERPNGVQAQPGRIWKGVALALFAAVSEAVGVVLSRAALTETSIDPLWSAFFRLFAAVIALFLWIFLTRRPAGAWIRQKPDARMWAILPVGVFMGTFIGIWLQQVALKLTAAGIAQTLMATSPLFVLLAVVLFAKERATWRAFIGVVLAIAGVGLIFLGK